MKISIMFLSILCRFMLTLLGWDFADKEKLEHENKKLVVLFPHTSRWDGVIAALFRCAYLYHRNVRLLIVQDEYKKYGEQLLDSLGFIPVNTDDTTGNTKKIANELNKLNEFIFVISPEGRLAKAPKLRSGFYYIAKETNAKIAVLNLDFYRQKIHYHEPWYPGDDVKEELKKVKDLFAKHPPLHPEGTDYAEHYKDIKHQLRPFKVERIVLFVMFLYYFRKYIMMLSSQPLMQGSSR